MSVQSFLDEVLGDARTASARTGVPVSTILAQWGIETGWGTSRAWRQGNNYAGVSPGGRIASYDTRASGLEAYISTMQSPHYTAVRAAGDGYAAAAALAASPWAASHYNDGQALTSVLDRYQLTQYDAGDAPTARPDGVPIVGGAVDALTGWFGGLKDGVVRELARVALTVVFTAGGLTLVALGAYRAVSPIRERVTQAAAPLVTAGAAA